MVSASPEQLSAICAEKRGGAQSGTEAFAHAGSNGIARRNPGLFASRVNVCPLSAMQARLFQKSGAKISRASGGRALLSSRANSASTTTQSATHQAALHAVSFAVRWISA